MFKKILITLLLISMAVPAFAYNKTPGEGITIRPARGPWVTGFFHAAIIEKGLRELGYDLKKTKELPTALFFKTVALGDVDYWPNGWFPLYDTYLEKFPNKISVIGYVVEKKVLQGYLVDKKTAEELNIRSLEDFKRPEVVKAFDKDGDGKADLTGAPHGWENVNVINNQIKEYGLTDYVKQLSASYEASMAANIAAFKSGEPIFYYTWNPSWTIYKLVPGKDVVWINVPYNIPTTGSEEELKYMRVSDVEGAISNPIDMGFSVADLRVIANNKFLENNPPAKKFLELFTIDLDSLNAQYTKLMEGEKSRRDINRHADEWIAKNQTIWNEWLEEARKTAN